jgi:hypothetical protein
LLICVFGDLLVCDVTHVQEHNTHVQERLTYVSVVNQTRECASQ